MTRCTNTREDVSLSLVLEVAGKPFAESGDWLVQQVGVFGFEFGDLFRLGFLLYATQRTLIAYALDPFA